MGATIVVGAQWGDEGKGKITDTLAEHADAVIRYNGGGNAGHTIVVDGVRYALHLLPSGIVRPRMVNIEGPGVVFDLEIGAEELLLAERCESRVFLDHSTPVVLPIHRVLDALEERAAGAAAIGTTKRGIGPAYSDYVARRGVRLGDLRSADKVREALTRGGFFERRCADARYLGYSPDVAARLGITIDPLSLDATIAWCLAYRDAVVPHLADTRKLVWDLYDENRELRFEGAQGVLLDPYHGSWPDCTSSCCTAAGVSATFGIYDFDRVVGVAKAYCTRVGNGPFPTELDNEMGTKLRERGHEFGTTTGRARRCGWLDLVALRYAVRVGGITELVITKLDVLSGLGDLSVCTAYQFDSAGMTADPGALTGTVLRNARPMYAGRSGWVEDLGECRSFDEIVPEALDYLDDITNRTGVYVAGVGVGPEREQIIWR